MLQPEERWAPCCCQGWGGRAVCCCSWTNLHLPRGPWGYQWYTSNEGICIKILGMWTTLWGVCMHLKRKHFVAWDQTWFFGPWFKGKESYLGKMLFLTSVYICPWTKRSTKHNIPKVFVKHTNVHQMAPNLSTLALVMAMLGRRLLLFAPWLKVARVGSESDLRILCKISGNLRFAQLINEDMENVAYMAFSAAVDMYIMKQRVTMMRVRQ